MHPVLTQTEFELFRGHIHKISGIALDDSKIHLVNSRLSPLLELFECNTYMQLYQKSQKFDQVNKEICSAITTNETSFFRDPSVFNMIQKNFIPFFLNKSDSLKIWSAGASFGQEAYSLAMILLETIINIQNYDIKIEGTDISNRAISYASYGLYTAFEVSRGIDSIRLAKHFNQVGNFYRIKDNLRYHVHFNELNMLGKIPYGPQFDIILCRNVAIYFDRDTKRYLFEKLAECLKPKGRLIIGSTETLWQITNRFYRHEYDGVVYYSLSVDEEF